MRGRVATGNDQSPRRARRGTAGEQGNGENAYAEVDSSGMVTVFTSTGDNLYPGDDNFIYDVFVRDLTAPGPP